MSGKRQHYLPRFLLKGFTSRKDDQKNFLWCFRKESEPVEISIRDIGLAHEFYGEPGRETLDEVITIKEKRLALVIQKARMEKKITKDDLPAIVNFVIDMITRTRFIRKTFTDLTADFLRAAQDHFSDPNKLRAILNHNDFQIQLKASIRKNIGIQPPQIEEALLALANSFAPTASSVMIDALKQVHENIKKEGNAAHKNALSRFHNDETSSERHNRYSKLNWSVTAYEKGTLILGDIAVFQAEKETGPFLPAIFQPIELPFLFLPISHDALLVGSPHTGTISPPSELLNVASAEMSIEFFLASVNSERERKYQKLIGERSRLATTEEIGEVSKNFFHDDK